jgi:predicted nucleic-acid-binding protein
MYAFIVSNLSNETTSIEVYNTLEDATNAFEEYSEIPGDYIYVLKISSGKTFGVNETGSFGGEELLTNY